MEVVPTLNTKQLTKNGGLALRRIWAWKGSDVVNADGTQGNAKIASFKTRNIVKREKLKQGRRKGE